MKKKDNLIIIVIFAAFISVIPILSLIMPDKKFSEVENRVLQQAPELTISKMFDGTFETELENYQNDQIAGRNSWTRLHSEVAYFLGARDINDVYIGKDGYLIEKTDEEDCDRTEFEKNLRAIQSFLNRLPDTVEKSVMPVPTTACIMKDKLPSNAVPFDEMKYADEVKKYFGNTDNVKYVNLYSAFAEIRKKSDVQIYYKTDHHWTAEGVYVALKTWKPETKLSDYTAEKLSNLFRGSLYSKVLVRNDVKDTIFTLQSADAVRNDDRKYHVTADGKRLSGMLDMKALKQKDKYAVFFGGNYGTVEISGGPRNGKTLMIIKDSFANAFVPAVADDFEKIIMVDPRYYRGNLIEYAEKERVSDVIVLYSMKNLIQDKNISALASAGAVIL